jgi:hypothetical protein
MSQPVPRTPARMDNGIGAPARTALPSRQPSGRPGGDNDRPLRPASDVALSSGGSDDEMDIDSATSPSRRSHTLSPAASSFTDGTARQASTPSTSSSVPGGSQPHAGQVCRLAPVLGHFCRLLTSAVTVARRELRYGGDQFRVPLYAMPAVSTSRRGMLTAQPLSSAHQTLCPLVSVQRGPRTRYRSCPTAPLARLMWLPTRSALVRGAAAAMARAAPKAVTAAQPTTIVYPRALS